jgi:hypothetical protein
MESVGPFSMKHVNEVKSPGPQESQKGERSKMTIKKEGTHSSTQVRNKFAYSIAAGSSIRMESVRPFSIKSVHQVKSTKWPTYLSKGEGPVKSSDAHTPARSKVKTSQVAHVPPQGQRSVQCSSARSKSSGAAQIPPNGPGLCQ